MNTLKLIPSKLIPHLKIKTLKKSKKKSVSIIEQQKKNHHILEIMNSESNWPANHHLVPLPPMSSKMLMKNPKLIIIKMIPKTIPYITKTAFMIQDSCSKIDIKIKINKNKKLKNNNVAKKMNIKPIKMLWLMPWKLLSKMKELKEHWRKNFTMNNLLKLFKKLSSGLVKTLQIMKKIIIIILLP